MVELVIVSILVLTGMPIHNKNSAVRLSCHVNGVACLCSLSKILLYAMDFHLTFAASFVFSVFYNFRSKILLQSVNWIVTVVFETLAMSLVVIGGFILYHMMCTGDCCNPQRRQLN
jgi:hypothetical protein